MKIKVQYTTEEERQNLIDSHNGLYLIEEWDVTEGKFLIFSDTKPEPPKVYVNVPQEEFEQIRQRQEATDAAVLQLLMEGMMK